MPQEKSQFTSPTQPYPVGQAFADQCAHKVDYTNPKTGKILKAPDGKPYKIGCIFTPYNDKQFVAYAPGTEGGSDWQPSSYNPTTHFQYVCGYNGNTALEAYPSRQLPTWVAGQSYFGSKFGYGVVKGFGDKGTPDQGAFRGGYMKAMDVDDQQGRLDGADADRRRLLRRDTDDRGRPRLRRSQSTTNPTYSAYDAATGKNLWNYPTGVKVAISAPGITYRPNGKQYVAVLQGGGGGNSNQQRNTGHGDVIDAFALP